MIYTAWMKDFLARRERLESLLRLQGLSDAEIWSYFSWENMRQREPNYCELYARNQKCHEMDRSTATTAVAPFFSMTMKESPSLATSNSSALVAMLVPIESSQFAIMKLTTTALTARSPTS